MSSPAPNLLLRPEQPILSTPVTICAQEATRTLTARLPDYHERFRLTMRDLCMGRGLVGYHAWKARRRFVGTELNPRRLACLLDRVAKDGGEVARI